MAANAFIENELAENLEPNSIPQATLTSALSLRHPCLVASLTVESQQCSQLLLYQTRSQPKSILVNLFYTSGIAISPKAWKRIVVNISFKDDMEIETDDVSLVLPGQIGEVSKSAQKTILGTLNGL